MDIKRDGRLWQFVVQELQLSQIMEKSFARNMDSLADIFVFLNGASESFNLDERTRYSINMAVEELFINMIKYDSGGTEDISVGLQLNDNRVTVRLVDYDSEPFDLTDLDEVDIDAPLEQRRPGGLGIHLVKCLMDEVSYQYKDRTTRIRLVKNL